MRVVDKVADGLVVNNEAWRAGDVVDVFDDGDHGLVAVGVQGEDEEFVLECFFEAGEDVSLGGAFCAFFIFFVEEEYVDCVFAAGLLCLSGEEPVSDFCEHVVSFFVEEAFLVCGVLEVIFKFDSRVFQVVDALVECFLECGAAGVGCGEVGVL